MEQLDLPVEIISSSYEETRSIGIKLASILKKGSIIGLRGPLGAGKTCFAKGIAEGIGIKEIIRSPTYTIISEYDSQPPLYHIDAYRLKGDDDFREMGGEEIVFGSGISLIEWCDRIPAFIPEGAIRVDIDIIDNEKRQIHIYREKTGN
ncbi:MAG: tRNA (adenosine(37)-N6)-threonylcarbamoyltransferase complex ATPase subunit type 1 TsaE [Treponema sp.]|nr:tRNA (adenosine(37)-N6)-threonylcarbamoyltransferase complex ATPase subunit type 1 TsaE [Treponema sp.]